MGCSYLCRKYEENIVVKVPHGFEDIVEGSVPPSVRTKLLESIRETANNIMRLRCPIYLGYWVLVDKGQH